MRLGAERGAVHNAVTTLIYSLMTGPIRVTRFDVGKLGASTDA